MLYFKHPKKDTTLIANILILFKKTTSRVPALPLLLLSQAALMIAFIATPVVPDNRQGVSQGSEPVFDLIVKYAERHHLAAERVGTGDDDWIDVCKYVKALKGSGDGLSHCASR